MTNKTAAICKSILWGLLVLLFPIMSGVLSVILYLDTIETLIMQGVFMIIALIPPIFLVLIGKWRWDEIGFERYNYRICRKALFFIPVLVIFIPVAIKGFYIKSLEYVLGSLFLYLFVGITEEVYYRGIVPKYLSKAFSVKETILISTLIFGVGHVAVALTGSGAFEIILTVFNAFIFGWLAMEMTILSRNIVPAILIHFFFDFETKIVAISGKELLIAECVRGMLMFIIAIWLAVVTNKKVLR